MAAAKAWLSLKRKSRLIHQITVLIASLYPPDMLPKHPFSRNHPNLSLHR
jgi:hypothetical protein